MPESELEKMYRQLGPELRRHTSLKGLLKVYEQTTLEEFDDEICEKRV